MEALFQPGITPTIAPGTLCARTISDTEGEAYTEMLAVLPRSSNGPELHRHPLQTIRLEAVDGNLGVILPDRRLIIRSGRSLEIPRNTEHAFYNADEKDVVFKSTLKPALHTEWMVREIKASAKRQRPGLKALLERSYILNQIKGEYYRSGLPAQLQNMVHAVLAGVGRLAGLHKKVSPLR